jgi:hypothetical protein
MADVSVEFGAKDTGLEQTLQTVQDELTRLNEEVKSGELSFDELQRAMRDISKAERVQDQLMGMADAAQDAGDSASDAAPEIDDAGDSMNEMGDSATDAGEKSEMGFAQMALAVAAGQAAVELAMGAIKAAIDAVTGTFDKFGQAIDRGAELDILSTRTGVASDELARLGRALDNTGASGDMLGPVFDRMNRAIAEASDGSGAAGEALAKLGINIQDLKTLSPEQQFEKIGTALSSVADRSERADMAIDIFGRGSGTRLLRLFEDYPGAIGQANRQLGIFPSIMAEMSASFEAVSTEMNAAREKVVEFATGILSRMMPAIEAIATGLASIDAAALGQKLADAFLGGQKAMGGFQAAIDAFQVGNIMDALNILWESTKLQSLQTANEVGRNLIAGFKSAGDFLGEIFDLNGALVRYMKGTFIFIGGKLQEALGGAVLGFIESLPEVLRKLNPVIGLVESSIRKGVTKAAEEANDQFALMYHSVDELKHQFVGAGSRISENMNKNLETTGDLIGGLDERAEALKKRQDEITAAVEKTNEEKGKGGPIDEEAKAAAEERAKREREAKDAIEESIASKKRSVQYQIDLNEAIVSGNTDEQKRIQNLIDAEKLQERINQLTDQFQKSMGLTKDEAKDMATAFASSEAAAKNIPNQIKTTLTADNEAFNKAIDDTLQKLSGLPDRKTTQMALDTGEWKSLEQLKKDIELFPNKKSVQMLIEQTGKTIEQLREEINGIPASKQIEIAMNVIGTGDVDAARRILDAVQNKNVEAAAKTTGFSDVQELKGALDGIPRQKVAEAIMRITGATDLDEAIGKLSQMSSREWETVVKIAGMEDVKNARIQIQDELKGIPDEKRIKAAVEASGLKDVDELKQAIKLLENKDVIVKAAVDRSEIDALKDVGVDMKVIPKIDKESLKDQIDVAVQGSKGSEHLTSIDKVVEAIKGLVEKIEGKLPMQALA